MLVESSASRAGRTFSDEIERGPLSVARLVSVVRPLLDALGAAHDKGSLHGDVTPALVVLTGDEQPEVVLCEGHTPPDLAYLAPERFAGDPSTVRSDLYSVGVICYEALAGAHPFRGESSVTTAYSTAHAALRPLRALRPDIPPALAAVIARAMARLPEERFPSAGELADALEDASSEGAMATNTCHPTVDESVPVAVRERPAPVLNVRVRAPSGTPPEQRTRVSNHAGPRDHAS